jgi:hypothetical protein
LDVCEVDWLKFRDFNIKRVKYHNNRMIISNFPL